MYKVIHPTEHRKRREAARYPIMPAVRHVSRRFHLPLPTAAAVAQAAGLNVGADR